MTTGELIIVAMFVVGVMCSLSLLWWLRKLIRGERDDPVTKQKIDQGRAEQVKQ